MPAFKSRPYTTQARSVGVTAEFINFTITQPQVLIDNRGDTDLIVELGGTVVEATSFRIPPRMTQVLTRPNGDEDIYCMRPTGSAAAMAFFSLGEGD